jgi:predicted transcriptional regulator
MYTPQELEVWYILPALRREIAIELKNNGLTQKDIASIMDITASAVSQYFHNKRAKNINFEIDKQIVLTAVKKILANKDDYARVIRESLQKISDKKLICKFHKSLEEVNKCCGLCRKKA